VGGVRWAAWREEIVQKVSAELKLSLDPGLVERALEELDRCGLLDRGPSFGPVLSRREAAKAAARIGGLALTAPLIYSVAVPTAAAAQSSTSCCDVCPTCSAGEYCADNSGVYSCQSDPCAAVNYCNGNGTCDHATGVCTCSSGTGLDCSTPSPPPSPPSPPVSPPCYNNGQYCSGNGECEGPPPDACDCAPGYTGPDCSMYICPSPCP
jgi:hypothetical protein